MSTNQRDLINGPPAGAQRINRGSNLLAVSQYNERLILQLIRRAGSLPKAEISRMTRLSAQTVSVIINRLLRDNLLRKQAPRREKGKLGQPAVPIALNPAGAYSIGVKMGRRSLDILLIDFVGNVLRRLSHHYDYPDPDVVFPKIEQDIAAVTADLSAAKRSRIVGIGIAAPYALGGWQQAIGAPKKALARWNNIDISRRVAASQELPVWFSNDATAACIAELEFGKGSRFNHYLYLFVGTFIGGGIVLNGTLYAGAFDNAGAIGSMPVPASYAAAAAGSGSQIVQLIHCASRYLLDDRWRTGGIDPDFAIACLGENRAGDLPAAADIFDAWLQRTAAAIAYACAAAISVVDFEGVVIDGALPQNLIGQLTLAVERELAKINLEGLVQPKLVAGTIGNDARALGGAILPFYSSFAPDREVLLKLGVEAGG